MSTSVLLVSGYARRDGVLWSEFSSEESTMMRSRGGGMRKSRAGCAAPSESVVDTKVQGGAVELAATGSRLLYSGLRCVVGGGRQV